MSNGNTKKSLFDWVNVFFALVQSVLTFITVLIALYMAIIAQNTWSDERSRFKQMLEAEVAPNVLLTKEFISLPIHSTDDDLFGGWAYSEFGDKTGLPIHNYGKGTAYDCEMRWDIYDKKTLAPLSINETHKPPVQHIPSGVEFVSQVFPSKLLQSGQSEGSLEIVYRDSNGATQKSYYYFHTYMETELKSTVLRMHLIRNHVDFTKPGNSMYSIN